MTTLEQKGPKPGRKPEGIYTFVLEGQPPRSIALVSPELTVLELKTRLPGALYKLRSVGPENIQLFVENHKLADSDVFRQVVPDGATIRLRVIKQ